MSANKYQRPLFIQHSDPGQDKQLDLKYNELNIGLLVKLR